MVGVLRSDCRLERISIHQRLEGVRYIDRAARTDCAARTCRHHTNIDGDGSVGHGAGIGLRDTIERNRSRLKMGLSNELCSSAFHNGIRSANNMLN
jgi:hypothetical protein